MKYSETCNMTRHWLFFLFAMGLFLSSQGKGKIAPIIVNSTSDSYNELSPKENNEDEPGLCTLRAALEDVKKFGDKDTIIIAVHGTVFIVADLPILSGGNLTIKGPGSALFAIDGRMSDGVGLRIQSNHNSISGITIKNCHRENLILNIASNNTFTDVCSDSSQAGTAGVEVVGKDSLTGSNYNTFTNCTFNNSHTGILFYHYTNHNTVSYSKATGNDHSAMNTFISKGNRFNNNTLDSNVNGMYLIRAANTIVETDTIRGSLIAGVNVFELASTGNIIRNNVFSGTGSDTCIGVEVDMFAGDVTVTHNTFTGFANGIAVGSMSGKITITSNVISDSHYSGILLGGLGGGLSKGAKVLNNSTDGIDVTPSATGYTIKGNNIARSNNPYQGFNYVQKE